MSNMTALLLFTLIFVQTQIEYKNKQQIIMETDWREILKFSQKELNQNEKEKLCESLSWMDADDIEISFSDLKILFKLTQDILKYKSEQVNSLLGKSKRKVKTKERGTYTESSGKSSDSVLETIAHQEEVIKANKEILEQLYADIAELEGRKVKYDEKTLNQQDSDSSRNTLSEINAIAQLENDISKRNKHIRKLLGDVKVLEEENTSLKDKLTIFKEKLKEATVLIENLTEQLFTLNKSNSNLKEYLGRTEEQKSSLYIELENLKTDINNKDIKYEKVEESVKSQLQQLKNLLKSHAEEIDRLTSENSQLKADLTLATKKFKSSKKNSNEEIKIKELQEKLAEASDQMIKSANIIQVLKNENQQLQLSIDDAPDSPIPDQKNESDDGKEKNMIIKLKNKIKTLSESLRSSEELIAMREKELTETAEHLQMLRSDEGINLLMDSVKKMKRDLKIQDERMKNLVGEVNTLNQIVSKLQLENETMREKLQIPLNEKIETHGILKNYKLLERKNLELTRQVKRYENKIISFEIDNHEKDLIISNLKTKLKEANVKDEIIITSNEDKEELPQLKTSTSEYDLKTADMQAIIEENEGLRNGLTEILNFLKDNSGAKSGVLALQCPSLEAVLNLMEARKSAGWFSPHMKTVMELKSALGSKDALMSALHESRNETFKVMTKLSKQEQKSMELEKSLEELITKNNRKETVDKVSSTADISIGEFGSWMKHVDYSDINLHDESDIRNIVSKGNIWFENQFKQALQYFHNKFTTLFEKFTTLTISTADDHNRWSIQEEYYKAEIENLKSQINENEDDSSNLSPGLVNMAKTDFVNTKYIFLEESYKQIRTLNENIKNEYLESKKDRLKEAFEYERKIQNLIQSIINLSDKLRNSIPVQIFLKQNDILNKLILKHRNAVEVHSKKIMQSENLFNRLEEHKIEVLEIIRKEFNENLATEKQTNIDFVILQKQLQQTCNELHDKNNDIEKLEKKVLDLQVLQSELMDKTIHLESFENENYFKSQLKQLGEENKILKEQYQDITNKLDYALLEVETYKNKELNNEKEVNTLRHQILDLQSTGNNKAIIARISSEVLLAQLQTSGYQDKIETLKFALNREKQLRAETEEVLMNRQKVFDIYTLRYDSRLRNMTEVIDILRQQYQGSLPLISIESFLDKMEEVQRKSDDFNAKLDEIEELQSRLMTKHSVYNQILDLSTANCLEDEDSCPHKIKNIIREESQKLEVEHYKRKLTSLEQSHKKLLERCELLEKTMAVVNQGFKFSDHSYKNEYDYKGKVQDNLELEDVQSDDDTSSRRSRTQTLSHPKVDIKLFDIGDSSKKQIRDKIQPKNLTQKKLVKNQETQTNNVNKIKPNIKSTQTETDESLMKLNSLVEKLLKEKNQIDKLMEETNAISNQRAQEITRLTEESNKIKTMFKNLTESIKQKDETSKKILMINESLKQEINNLKSNQSIEIDNLNKTFAAEHQTIIAETKKIENDKNEIVDEYSQLLRKEREDYTNSLKGLQTRLKDLQSKLDKKETVSITYKDDAIKEASSKYTLKICELEEKCFKLQSELDECKAESENQLGELERWKSLASERLTKMEQLNAQLKERHAQEVESYKAENQHWLTQLKETQREHIDLRGRLTEQRTLHLKQMTEKDNHIEQLRSVINNLKTQILNMQTMLTINDPSFDLSAIVEVDEVSDGISQQESDRLELKFDSTVDINETSEDFIKMPCTSTAIWQEPLIERLRREKQLMSKQNAILRRQIKVLAARERRSRLDAQNLKNQVFRISTTGNKVPSAESAALQNKIASLQAQLTSARRDANSNVALWDKWKRAQQSSDRWQARYEEKCQEVKKLETSLSLSKSAISRLDKEKRILLSRLEDEKQEKHLAIEKQDAERSEKALTRSEQSISPPTVSTRALLDRVEAQQRRIAAYELAEMGNETLVSEYEKSLAEITSLKGQVLKLESTLLEAQIRSPLKSTSDVEPELQYWRKYCDMLKEENMQLTLRVNSLDCPPISAHHQRVNDLEQTILTLRGLVSKLQADQKSSTSVQKRVDSRPGSGRSGTDKIRGQIESYRTEISNLKRSIVEKDALLEKSKDMLKIAAEREEEILRENMLLRRRLDQLTKEKEGFMSA